MKKTINYFELDWLFASFVKASENTIDPDTIIELGKIILYLDWELQPYTTGLKILAKEYGDDYWVVKKETFLEYKEKVKEAQEKEIEIEINETTVVLKKDSSFSGLDALPIIKFLWEEFSIETTDG